MIFSGKTDFNPRAPHGARPVARLPMPRQNTLQSTRSTRSATSSISSRQPCVATSIHALHTERDGKGAWHHIHPRNFNPRAPHGARLSKEIDLRLAFLLQSTRSTRSATDQSALLCIPMSTSIHALHTERDSSRRENRIAHEYFNPRAPHGARRRSDVSVAWRKLLQSTRSTRSATDQLWGLDPAVKTSIHALHTERDSNNLWLLFCSIQNIDYFAT